MLNPVAPTSSSSILLLLVAKSYLDQAIIVMLVSILGKCIYEVLLVILVAVSVDLAICSALCVVSHHTVWIHS